MSRTKLNLTTFGLSEESRLAVCRWLEDHGMNPGRVPDGSVATFEDGYVWFEEIQLDSNGELRIDRDEFATVPVRKPLVAPFPLIS